MATSSYGLLQKILGLTSSSNDNERKAAKLKLDQLLEKHGVTLEELQQKIAENDGAPEESEPINFYYGKAKKRFDPALVTILQAVSTYYNGTVIRKWVSRDEGRILDVIASSARKIEIEIYTEFLLDQLNIDFEKHIKENPLDQILHGREFKNSYRKNWAFKVAQRFRELKKTEQVNGREIKQEDGTVFTQEGLVVQKKNNTELARNNALVKKLYPRLASASGYTRGGSGSSAGREAGGSVSLNRQVAGSSRRRLAGV